MEQDNAAVEEIERHNEATNQRMQFGHRLTWFNATKDNIA